MTATVETICDADVNLNNVETICHNAKIFVIDLKKEFIDNFFTEILL